MNIYKNLENLSRKFILTFVILAFGFGNLYAQHVFSVRYNELSQENVTQIKAQAVSSNVTTMSLAKDVRGE